MTTAVRPRERASMRTEEYAVLRNLLVELQPKRTLEVGMANGQSTVVICDVLRGTGDGKHTAVDPFQIAPDAWNGRGLRRIREAGLEDFLELIEDFDYLALPRLVAERREYDFILIDGWHSFDYTMLDLFYADLLLRPGGVLAIHDTGQPSVYRACRFLETHKPYDRVSPPIGVVIPSLVGRAARRASRVWAGRAAMGDAKRRRTEWFSLAAYRKRQHHKPADDFYADF